MASRNNKNSKLLPILLICLVMGLIPYFTWFTSAYSKTNDLIELQNSSDAGFANQSPDPYTTMDFSVITPELGQLTPSPNIDLLPSIDKQNDLPQLSPTDFVSGIFYGVMILSLIATLSLYVVYKHRKWAVFLLFQAILLVGFSYADIGQYIVGNEIFYILPYFQHLIVIATVIYSFYLLSYFYNFAIQRIAYKYQFKIYSLVTLIGLCILAYSSMVYDTFPLLLYISVIVLVAVTQVAIYKINSAKRKAMSISLLTTLIILYTLIFTDLQPVTSLLSYQNTITIYKLIVIITITVNLYLNYLLLIKHYKKNLENEVFISQYVSLIKNYHKLLVEEKKSQNEPYTDIGQFKDNSQELEEHLKSNYKLTDREFSVLLLIWDGYTNKQISEQLSITLSTAKYHIGNIYIKLNVNSRSQVFALKG